MKFMKRDYLKDKLDSLIEARNNVVDPNYFIIKEIGKNTPI